MSSGPIATASVKIIPDLTGFKALLRAEVNKSIATIKVTPIKVPVIAMPHRASLRNEVNASVRSLQITPIRVPVVVAPLPAGAGGAAAAAAAGGVPVVRGASGAGAGAASGAAAKGVNELTKSSQALRGSLIGLSHITPVTVFGLGLYGTAALAAGLAVKSALSSTADFEHQLNVFQATTGATTDQMIEISEEAKKLGADLTLPSTSAGDAARAMTELAKAGLTVNDTLKGTRGVLQLAAAAQIDVGTAAQFVATELNAFELSGENATHVADLLSGASIAAQGDIRDFGTAFQQVSAVAHGANVSLETTTGLLTELARAGLRGADAGTSIRTFLLRLTPTTKQAAQYQEALNIKLDETKTIGEQLPELLKQYQDALAGVNPILRQQALTQIFGQDAIRAATILIRGGTDALDENTNAANQNGAAARLAAANAKGLSGALNGLKSNADTLGITLGNLVKGPLTSFTTLIAQAVGDTNAFADALIKVSDNADKALKGITVPGTDGQNADDFLKNLVGTAGKLPISPVQLIALWGVEVRGIKAAAAARRKAVADAAKEARLGKLNTEGGVFGVGNLPPGAPPRAGTGREEGGLVSPAQAAANAARAANAAATEARLKALQADKNRRKPKVADITPPRDLQVDLLNAQISESLQAELKADKAIEGYFHKRLKLAIEGTLRYKQILQALAQAHAATTSVLGQINQDSKQAQVDRKQAIDDAISLQRSRLENAAELTDHTGEAEKKLIAFYRAQSKNLQLETSARLAYEAAYNSEIKTQKAAIVAQVKADIDLRNARLDLAIQRAGLTPGEADDRRAINAKIKKLQGDIKAIQKIKHLTTEQKREIVSLQSEIVSLQQSLKQAAGQSNSFSLQDLFKAAADQFTTFGSNISSRNGVLSGQDERAAFGKSVLDKRDTVALRGSGQDKRTTLAGQQLTQQEKTNTLLQLILARIGTSTRAGGIGGAPAVSGKGSSGNLQAIYGAEIAAAYNYGVN